MRVLLVGSGGREHALAWKLSQSPLLTELHAAPGSPGIAQLAECHPIRAEDAEGLLTLAHGLGIGLVVVGPEAPLVAGVADVLRHAGVSVFGPSAAAAAIEGSKSFAKDVLTAAGVPTAAALPIARPPCVVKADGLAAGKGVHVCRTQDEVDAALRSVGALGGRVVVEELLEGPEVSLFALCDGYEAVAFPPAQDFKRALRRGRGAEHRRNGLVRAGSGARSRPRSRSSSRPSIDPCSPSSRRVGRRSSALLYAGLMLTEDGLRVLEFNCRFGDPETQSLVPLVESDLLEALAAAAAGELAGVGLEVRAGAAVTVVLAARDYPQSGDRGSPISGVARAEADGALVFHAGTALQGTELMTNGGRVLAVTGLGDTLAAAREAAYAGVGCIEFAGARFRTDIALDAVAGRPLGVSGGEG